MAARAKGQRRQERPPGGLRLTRQRAAVLEVLQSTRTHPTADRVYLAVKRKIPNVSLATIYRTLATLRDHGLILEMDYGHASRRYDGNPQNHYHVRCLDCGRVEDAGLPPQEALEAKVEAATGYRITGHRLEWLGFCPQCQRRRG